MRNRNVCISILLLAALPFPGLAQQNPLISLYSVNKYIINPALAGATGYTNVNFTARQMYTGFENSPGVLYSAHNPACLKMFIY